MIPRRLHYCWFGGTEPGAKERFCMDSWKRYCPDFELVRWDESNSPIEDIDYVAQAYKAKKWAFVSDYVRLKALYEQGGIYLDTDVELRKPLDPFLDRRAFMGFENPERVGTCLIGAEAGHPFFGELLKQYRSLAFIRPDGTYDYTTNVQRVSAWLREQGLICDGTAQTVAGITLYPQTFFSPKDLTTGKTTLSEDTFAIHHFRASWMPLKNRVNTKLAQLLGPKHTQTIKQLLGRE